jgi:hypothetical protein
MLALAVVVQVVAQAAQAVHHLLAVTVEATA